MILKDAATFQVLFYSISILCLEHHYCGDQQWRSLTEKLNPPSASVYFRWSWSPSCYFGLGLVSSGLGHGLKNLVLFTSLPPILVGFGKKIFFSVEFSEFL